MPQPNAERHFPTFEKLFESGQFETVLRNMEKTSRALEEIARGGSASDRDRARAAALAYNRTFHLIREIVKTRNEMAAKPAISAPVAR